MSEIPGQVPDAAQRNDCGIGGGFPQEQGSGSLGEVAGSESVVEMMQALRIIGAEKMAAFCERSFRDVLGNITLPLSDEMNDAMDEQLCELDDVGSRACRYHELDEVIQEFRTAIAQYVLKYMKPEK